MSISLVLDALLAVLLLTVGGWFVVGLLLFVIRRHVFKQRPEDCWGALDSWLGSTERIVATTMFVPGVSYLPAFIGAWVVLKLAANWQRIKSESDGVRKGTLIALIGNVFSFALAIAVGFWLNPTAITHFIK